MKIDSPGGVTEKLLHHSTFRVFAWLEYDDILLLHLSWLPQFNRFVHFHRDHWIDFK